MGSTSAENGAGKSAETTAAQHGTDGVGRRALIKRSAALGLVSVPAMGFLSACASGGGGGELNDDTQGETSKDNPFGVKKGTKLDVVIFKGGYRDDYAKAWEAAFRKKWGVTSTHTGTQDITGKLQPRFNAGQPAGHRGQLRRPEDQDRRPPPQRPAPRPGRGAGRAERRRPCRRRSATPLSPAPSTACRRARSSPSTTSTRCGAVVLRQALRGERLGGAQDLGRLPRHLQGRQVPGHRRPRPPGQVPVLHQRRHHGPDRQEGRPGRHEGDRQPSNRRRSSAPTRHRRPSRPSTRSSRRAI
ncbi:hypothetical protein SGLAM104S_07901 [Streptomyces glaucescens]